MMPQWLIDLVGIANVEIFAWILAYTFVLSVVGFVAFIVFMIAKTLLRIPAAIIGWFLAETAFQSQQSYRRRNRK